MIAVYMPAAYGAAWQYCSYSRINLPLLKITFCFHTVWAVMRPRSLSDLTQAAQELTTPTQTPDPNSGLIIRAAQSNQGDFSG